MLRKIGRVLMGIIVVIGVVFLVMAFCCANPIDCNEFYCPEELATVNPLVMAHRGGRGLWPENTFYAFEHAVDLGVDVLEMDIHSTADGVLVTMHDDSVDRTTDGSGPIHGFTLAELQKLDAGYYWTSDDGQTYPYRGQGITVPTLEEIFTAFPEMLMNIEIKQVEPPIVTDFCQMLREYGRTDKVLVGSFDAATLKDFRKACSEVPTSVTEPEARIFFALNKVLLDAAYRPGAEAFQLPEYHGDLHVVTRNFVEGAHDYHMPVNVWTVNETEDMDRLLSLGVDGIITDYPDRLLEVLER